MEAVGKTVTTNNRGVAARLIRDSSVTGGYIGKRSWWDVVEYESDPILSSLVSHTVLLLVVYFVSPTDF